MCGEIFWLLYDLRRPLVGSSGTKYPALLRTVCTENFLFQYASSVPFETHCFRELEPLSYIISELPSVSGDSTQGHTQMGSPKTICP